MNKYLRDEITAKITFNKHSFKNSPFTLEEFKKIIEKREIYIWGGGLEGRGFFLKCKKVLNLKVKAFIDTRKFKDNKIHNIEVIKPETFYSKYADPNKVFIHVTTAHREFKRIAIAKNEKYNFIRNKDYTVQMDLCDYIPIIEVTGNCNLKCITCTVGAPDFVKGSLMKVDYYEKILAKMSKDIPFLTGVYLYLWGEPFIHPKLDEIIKITHKYGLACDISTNLNLDKHLDKIMKAEPDILTLACSGTDKNYAVTHTGGNFNKFHSNLLKVKDCVDKYKLDTHVRFYYHMYKHNLNEEYNFCKKLADDLGFWWYPIIAQLFPQHIYHHVVNNKPLPPQYHEAKDLVIYDYEDHIKTSFDKRKSFCPVYKAFPTIRYNGSVVHCSLMTDPTVSKNFLDEDFENLKEKRRKQGEDTCVSCMSYGMHKFFDVANVDIKMEKGRRVAVYKNTENFKAKV